MNDYLPELTLLLCVAGSVYAHIYAWMAIALPERLPLLVYSGSYLITSVIGATMIGLADVSYLEFIGGGSSTVHIREIGTSKYWLLVYLPLIITPLVVAQFGRRRRGITAEQRGWLASDFCQPLAYIGVLIGATVFCAHSLVQQGFDISLSSWSRLSGEFSDLMVLRSSIMDSVGYLFFCFVYSALPPLSFVALYQIRKHGSLTWWVLFSVTFFVTCWLGLSTIQKAITLLYFTSVCLACLELRFASYKHLAIGGVIGCVILTIMQQYFMGEWSFLQSVRHITHRVGMSFPYYASVYPAVIPYSGLDCGLWLFGIGSPPTDNADVFDIMYPDITWIVGTAAAPAHLRLYSQCGMPGALGSLVAIGLGIGVVMRLRDRVAGPIAFAVYIHALVVIYYATQVSLIDLFVTAYGLPWCALTLGPLWIWAIISRQRRGSPSQGERRGNNVSPVPRRTHHLRARNFS